MPLFTPTEQEIIKHRLGVPDAIAEVLVASDIEQDNDLIVRLASELYDKLDAVNSWDDLNSVEQEIIIDTVDGSTFIAGLEADFNADEITQQKLSSNVKVITNLAEKISGYSGQNVSAATW